MATKKIMKLPLNITFLYRMFEVVWLNNENTKVKVHVGLTDGEVSDVTE